MDFLDTEAARSGTQLGLEEGPPTLMVSGDPDLLHQVFLNVLLNALRSYPNRS